MDIFILPNKAERSRRGIASTMWPLSEQLRMIPPDTPYNWRNQRRCHSYLLCGYGIIWYGFVRVWYGTSVEPRRAILTGGLAALGHGSGSSRDAKEAHAFAKARNFARYARLTHFGPGKRGEESG